MKTFLLSIITTIAMLIIMMQSEAFAACATQDVVTEVKASLDSNGVTSWYLEPPDAANTCADACGGNLCKVVGRYVAERPPPARLACQCRGEVTSATSGR